MAAGIFEEKKGNKRKPGGGDEVPRPSLGDDGVPSSSMDGEEEEDTFEFCILDTLWLCLQANANSPEPAHPNTPEGLDPSGNMRELMLARIEYTNSYALRRKATVVSP